MTFKGGHHATIESIDRAMQHITLIDELEIVISDAIGELDFAKAEQVQMEQIKSVREVSRLQMIAKNLESKGIKTEVVNHV